LAKVPWHEIVTHIDKDGEPTGGFILPRTVDDKTVERLRELDLALRGLSAAFGVPPWFLEVVKP
jgi:hypothetical protein